MAREGWTWDLSLTAEPTAASGIIAEFLRVAVWVLGTREAEQACIWREGSIFHHCTLPCIRKVRSRCED